MVHRKWCEYEYVKCTVSSTRLLESFALLSTLSGRLRLIHQKNKIKNNETIEEGHAESTWCWETYHSSFTSFSRHLHSVETQLSTPQILQRLWSGRGDDPDTTILLGTLPLSRYCHSQNIPLHTIFACKLLLEMCVFENRGSPPELWYAEALTT
jgi:hypothetical protein